MGVVRPRAKPLLRSAKKNKRLLQASTRHHQPTFSFLTCGAHRQRWSFCCSHPFGCPFRPLLLASVAFTSLVGSLLGYDIGIISGAIIYIEKDLHITEVQAEVNPPSLPIFSNPNLSLAARIPARSARLQVIVGSLNLVSAFGGLSSGYIADRIGRKGTLGLATSIFIVGTFVMCISSSFGGLLLGRVIMGLGIGDPWPAHE